MFARRVGSSFRRKRKDLCVSECLPWSSRCFREIADGVYLFSQNIRLTIWNTFSSDIHLCELILSFTDAISISNSGLVLVYRSYKIYLVINISVDNHGGKYNIE